MSTYKDKPLRIVYSFPHTLGAPGIGTTAAHQIRELISQGIDVRVYCTSSRVSLEGARSVVQTLSFRGRRVPHRSLGVTNSYRYHDLRVALAIRELGAGSDLVHAWPASCRRTFAAASRLRIPSLREVPNPHTQSAFEEALAQASAVGVKLSRSDPHRYSSRKLRKECAEYDVADFLLTPSEYVAHSFTVRGYPEAKIVPHHYGFDPKAFPRPSLSELQCKRPFTALFVGRGEPRKGLHFALSAWLGSGVADRGRFLISGTLDRAYRQKLAPMLAHSSVIELGFVRDVGAVMRSSDVLLFPTMSEGSALVTYEAMASGCVPLTSDAAGAPVRHLADGLIHRAGDVHTLTNDVRWLADDRKLLHRMRKGALARREELSWEAAGSSLAGAYKICLSRHLGG